MVCCWLTDGVPCGLPAAEANQGPPVCPEHYTALRLREGSTARQAAKYHDLSEFPGFCYFALMPDGLVKIGYSNTEKLCAERMKALGRKAGAPVIHLAKTPGGFVAEAVMHKKFADSRVPGTGETFTYSPEMAKFIATLPRG